MTFPTEAQAFAVAEAIAGRRVNRLDGSHPTPPSVAVPEQRDRMIPPHFNVDECRGFRAGYNHLRAMLTASPSPDHSGDANKMVEGFIEDQEPLGTEFETVYEENIGELYEFNDDYIADAGKVDGVDGWPGSITRSQAIKILDRATDKDDPHWEFVVDDFYDEDSDTMPSIFHVFAAIGVTEEEYREAAGVQNIDWPASATPSVPENEIKARALEDAAIKVVAEAVEIEIRLDDGQDIVEGTALIEEHIAEWLHKEAARLRTAGDEGEETHG